MKKFILVLSLGLALFILATFAFWVERLSFWFYPTPQEFLPQAEQIRPNFLVIASLGIAAPIIEVGEADEQIFQEALRQGVVHYPGTARIGERGNVYIFGHSSDFAWAKGDYKTVFALLPKIKKGDEILVSNQQGEKFVYRVSKTAIASPRDIDYLDQGNREKKLLTLQTSYPLGTALKRFIVVAEAE